MRRHRAAQLLPVLAALALGMSVLPPATAATAAAPIQFTRFASASAFAGGTLAGLVLDTDRLVITRRAAGRSVCQLRVARPPGPRFERRSLAQRAHARRTGFVIQIFARFSDVCLARR